MRRTIVLACVLAIAAAACGGSGASPALPPDTLEAERAGASTTVEPPATEAPAAPDFTMALADSGSFTLSEAASPVYMVFWAEW